MTYFFFTKIEDFIYKRRLSLSALPKTFKNVISAAMISRSNAVVLRIKFSNFQLLDVMLRINA